MNSVYRRTSTLEKTQKWELSESSAHVSPVHDEGHQKMTSSRVWLAVFVNKKIFRVICTHD